MASFIRDSKFRNLHLQLAPRQEWYENLHVSDRSVNGSLLAAAQHSLAFAHGSGNGNAVCMLPLASTGKNLVPTSAAAYSVPLLRTGSGRITALEYDPFDEYRLYTAADDGALKLWSLPEGGLSADLTGATAELQAGSEGRLEFLAPHRSAQHVLASGTLRGVEIWDLEAGAAAFTHGEAYVATELQGVGWSYNGDLLVTTAKDCYLRLQDPRAGTVGAEVAAHANGRDTKSVWAGNTPYLISVGFTASRSREMALWDSRNLEAAVMRKRLDANTGPMFPVFDPDASLFALSGRGDVTLKFFEMQHGRLHDVAACNVGSQVRGLALLPKLANDLRNSEVLRVLKLSASAIEPVSATVPRRHKGNFEPELFPPTFAGTGGIPVSEWLGGRDEAPALAVVRPPAPESAAASQPQPEATDAFAALDDEFDEDEKLDAGPPQHQRWSSSLQNRFKHLRGKEVDLHRTWFNLRVNASAPDGDLLAASGRFFALPYAGGGGAVYVGSLASTGKTEATPPLVAGHRAPVVSLAFSPHDDCLLATGSDDCDVRVWRIPDEGVTESWDDSHSLVRLQGHNNGVRSLDFHPLAENLLVSTGMDNLLALWDVNAGTMARSMPLTVDPSGGGCFNLAFDYKGDNLAAYCRDKDLRLYDLRSMAVTGVVPTPHAGAKGGRVAWCCRDGSPADIVATTGWNRQSLRELKIWDPRQLAAPVKSVTLDQGSGALQPLWDEGTATLMLAGRGETSLTCFEIVPSVDEEADAAQLVHLDAFRCAPFMSRSEPQICCALLPKQGCDVRDLEFLRLLRMTPTAVEPVSFFLPRAAALKAYFNDDVYPDARRREAPLTASDWLAGEEAEVPRESLRPEGMPLLSEKPVEKRVSNAKILMREVNAERAREERQSQSFSRMQDLAHQYAKYNPNASMGQRKGPDAISKNDDDEVDDDEWDD